MCIYETRMMKRRNWELQIIVNKAIDEYYDLVMAYKILEEKD